MVHYSEAALYNKFYRKGWIDLCNNDCGKLVYLDVEIGTPKNATGTDSDVLHKDTCSKILELKEFARSINWYPNLAIDRYLEAVFKALHGATTGYDFGPLVEACEMLRDKIAEQKSINEQTRKKWDEKKRKKLEAKRLQDEHEARQVDQQSQYDVLIRNVDFRKRWQIESWPIE
jgi:hypothetical protein